MRLLTGGTPRQNFERHYGIDLAEISAKFYEEWEKAMKSSGIDQSGVPAQEDSDCAPLAHRLSDEEIICTFMEPKPTRRPRRGPPDYGCGISEQTWWIFAVKGRWEPRDFTLDALWEIQERLTDEQWDRYEDVINCHDSPGGYLHATPEQKIRALAAVLRPLVERQSASGE